MCFDREAAPFRAIWKGGPEEARLTVCLIFALCNNLKNKTVKCEQNNNNNKKQGNIGVLRTTNFV